MEKNDLNNQNNPNHISEKSSSHNIKKKNFLSNTQWKILTGILGLGIVNYKYFHKNTGILRDFYCFIFCKEFFRKVNITIFN